MLTVVRMLLNGGEMLSLRRKLTKLCAFISVLAFANVNKWTIEVKLMRHALFSHYFLLTVFSTVLPEVAFYCSCCVYAAASWSREKKTEKSKYDNTYDVFNADLKLADI